MAEENKQVFSKGDQDDIDETDKICFCCEEEKRKHQVTKRALDKAIKLANTLLDQLSMTDIRKSQ